MKRIVGLAIVMLVLLPVVAFSQTRPRSARGKTTGTTAKRTSRANAAADLARGEGAAKVAELSAAEIATALDTDSRTVSTRLWRSLGRLRATLEDQLLGRERSHHG